MFDEIYATKRKEDEARTEQVYAKIDPQGYYEKYGQWPEETEMQRKERELNNRLEEARELDAKMASHYQAPSAPEPKFANPYDNADVAHTMEAMVSEHRKEDAPKKAILEELKEHLPESSEDLKQALEALDYRLDFMKELVEHYGAHFDYKAEIYDEDFTPEASIEVNKALSDYLNLVATLADCNYNFGSTTDSYANNSEYDPYRPEMYIDLASSVMFRRARNDCDINIPIPKNYRVGSPTADAVTILRYLDSQLKHVEDIDLYWDKLIEEALENTAPSGPKF